MFEVDPKAEMLALVGEMFAAGDFAGALRLSETIRSCGYFDCRLAVVQAVCLEALGHSAAALERLDELERAGGTADVLSLAREWLAGGKHARGTVSELTAQATRFIPRLPNGGAR